MDLHRRKLWADRATWLIVAVALAVITRQYVTQPSPLLRNLLVGFSGVVVALLVFSELRIGRSKPPPRPQSAFTDWALYVGAEREETDGRDRTRTAAVAGVLEADPGGIRWRARSDARSGPSELHVGWRDLYSWRIQAVMPLLPRANGYLAVVTEGGDELVFHVHDTRGWSRALAEAAVTLPTYQRPDWLPDEAGAELPVLMSEVIDPDSRVPRTLVGEIAVPAYRQAPPERETREEPQPEPEPEEEPAEVSQAESYEPVIGLECHVELSTASKVFCGCPTIFGAPPNTQICPVCTGQPGTLPVLNERALEYAIRIALALNCDIAADSVFHRKNYFYPDMPKNYQISQYDLPLATGGWIDVEVDGATRRIGIHRVHLEEDTGKTTHVGGTGRIGDAEYAKVDYNRAGVPLVEVVSEPDLRSPEEARAYLSELRALLQAIEVSDVRMEEGSLRCDANVSVRPSGTTGLGTKTEVKNMNSIRSVQRALAFEIERQVEIVGGAGRVVQETRHFEEASGRTLPGRSKEMSEDYRYFPDPDLLEAVPDPAWIERIRGSLPELPAQRRRRLVEAHALPEVDARTLTSSKGLADAYEEAVAAYEGEPKAIARWYIGELSALANEKAVEPHLTGVSPRQVVALQSLVDAGTISISVAKSTVLRTVAETGREPTDVVSELGVGQISGTDELAGVVEEVVGSNEALVEQIRGGKTGAVNALVGQVMKRTQGRANPEVVRSLLDERLGLV